MLPQPELSEVRDRLRDLIAGRRTREDVADWAGQWIYVDEPQITDWNVWEALQNLVGADLGVSPTEYLHSEVDFRAWLAEIERQD